MIRACLGESLACGCVEKVLRCCSNRDWCELLKENVVIINNPWKDGNDGEAALYRHFEDKRMVNVYMRRNGKVESTTISLEMAITIRGGK